MKKKKKKTKREGNVYTSHDYDDKSTDVDERGRPNSMTRNELVEHGLTTGAKAIGHALGGGNRPTQRQRRESRGARAIDKVIRKAVDVPRERRASEEADKRIKKGNRYGKTIGKAADKAVLIRNRIARAMRRR